MFKKIKAMKATQLKFEDFQALSQHKKRGWTLRNILVYFWLKYSSSYKKHEAYKVDYLISGDNYIISLLVLVQIVKKIKEDYKSKKIKIGILESADSAKWSYHIMKSDSFWKEVASVLKENISSMDDFVKFISNGLQKEDQDFEVIVIKSDDLIINNVNFDSFSNKKTIHLSEQKSFKNTLTDAMPKVSEAEGLIKEWIKKTVLKNLNNKLKIKELNYSNKGVYSEDSEIKSNILICDEMILTSLPYWANVKMVEKEGVKYCSINGVKTYGSASKIVDNFFQAERQTKEDILLLIKSSVGHI